MMTDNIDQTEEDIVTGVDLVEGTLVFKRHGGSTLEVPVGTSGPLASLRVNADFNDTPTCCSTFDSAPRRRPTRSPTCTGSPP